MGDLVGAGDVGGMGQVGVSGYRGAAAPALGDVEEPSICGSGGSNRTTTMK